MGSESRVKTSMVQGLRGSGVRDQGSGVRGPGLRVEGLGFRVQG
jgi:hypothetical protein